MSEVSGRMLNMSESNMSTASCTKIYYAVLQIHFLQYDQFCLRN